MKTSKTKTKKHEKIEQIFIATCTHYKCYEYASTR
jgi:hypothetical protein